MQIFGLRYRETSGIYGKRQHSTTITVLAKGQFVKNTRTEIFCNFSARLKNNPTFWKYSEKLMRFGSSSTTQKQNSGGNGIEIRTNYKTRGQNHADLFF
jgi:hypothetical protein